MAEVNTFILCFEVKEEGKIHDYVSEAWQIDTSSSERIKKKVISSFIQLQMRS